jgi:hypothetical protein
MSLVLSLRVEGTEGLSRNIRDVVRQASANPGTLFEVEKVVSERLCEELTAKTAPELVQVRKRERSLPPQVLALHLG